MKLKRRSSYLTEIGWYLVRLILGILQMDPFAFATVALLGVWAYIFIPILCADGIVMGIMLSLIIVGGSMGSIVKFIGLMYVSNNVDNISGNLNARFDNLVTGKENNFIPTSRKGFKRFPCKYIFVPENESDEADLRACKTNWWKPSEEEKKKAMSISMYKKQWYDWWAKKGYVPGWYMEFTIQNGQFVNEPSEYAVEQAAKLKKRK